MTHRSDQRPDTPMISAVATRCRLTYGNRARGFHQGQSNQLLTDRPVIVTQSFLCSSALQFRGSPYRARSVLLTAMRHSDRMSRWAVSLQARCGYHKALVAIAAKNARIAWALLAKNQTLRAV